MADGGRRWVVRPRPDRGTGGAGSRRGIRPAGLTVFVAALALAVFGTLAYIGVFRLRARAEGLTVGGHWVLDAASARGGVVANLAALIALREVAERSRGPHASATDGFSPSGCRAVASRRVRTVASSA
jgi:hypothetical protein